MKILILNLWIYPTIYTQPIQNNFNPTANSMVMEDKLELFEGLFFVLGLCYPTDIKDYFVL